MKSTTNDDPEVTICDYALMLLKSTENLKKTLQQLTDEMKVNNPKATLSEIELKKDKIKKASSMMKISSRLLQMLRNKKKKDLSGKSSGSSISVSNKKKKSLGGSSHKLKLNRSKESNHENVIKTNVYRDMTPKPSVIQKSELQLAKKTNSRLNASSESKVHSNATYNIQLKSHEMHFDDSLFNAVEVIITAWHYIKNQLF